MHHYRQALLRMRQGESDRDIAAARLMGRRKAGDWRALAKARGWLDPQVPLPDDQAVCDALAPPKRASSTVSSLEAHRAKVASWVEQGVSGTAIHQALARQHGWSGSYSGVRRMVAAIRAALPPEVTCRLEFAPAEAAQVDFGAGPMMTHPSGQMRRTWAFVMTLAHSRHQYLEFVWDQTVATWLGCHRRALEWFNGVPQRIVIDNAKCAITRACAQDPVVQRAYAECAEGYGFKIDPCPPYDPQKKGIVEAGVKYVKTNFLPLREFRDLADLNAQARQWVSDEVARREQKKFSSRLRRAQFRTTKTLDQFDFERLPSLNRALVHDLATGRYLHEKAPVLIVGPCGTGKSHLAQALGHCAVRQGVDVVFTTCAALTQSLNAARAVGSYERKLASLARVPLLIIDDFGLKPLRSPADEDLHDLMAERYEQTATIVTSNLDFPEWDQAFPNNRLLGSATLDRLRHNAYCMVLDGASYRAPKTLPATTKSAPAKAAK
jgi:DNA replication protein DnaC